MLTERVNEIRDMAQCVSEEWKNEGRSLESFCDIVDRHFSAKAFEELSDISNLQSLLGDPAIAKLQTGSTFSDAHFKLFDDGYFWIEILTWWSSDVNTHDHDFSAIQYQLLGESIDVKYKFVPSVEDGSLEVGEVVAEGLQVWSPGTKSVVVPGRTEPHLVYHLDQPTVSLLVRTHPREEIGGQRNYFPPFVRADYTEIDNAFRLNLKYLRLLSKDENKDRFAEVFRRSVLRQTANETMLMFSKLNDILFSPKHADVLAWYVESGAPGAVEIVQCASKIHTSNYVSNYLRKSPTSSREDRKILSAFAASYDVDSFRSLCSQIPGLEDVDVERALRQALGNSLEALPEWHARETRRVTELHGLSVI